MSSLAERLAAAREHERRPVRPRRRPPPLRGGPGTHPAGHVAAAAVPARRPRRLGRRRRRRPRTAPAAGDAASPGRGSAEHDRLEELKQDVHTELLKQLGPQLYDANLDQAELDQRVRGVLADVLGSQDRPLSNADRTRITQEISDDILGYGPIEPFLRDPDVTEVMVNGPDQHLPRERRQADHGRRRSSADEAHLRRTIDKIVSRIGRRVDESSPMVDARLPDGSRVNAVIPPLALDGSAAHHPQVRRRPAAPSTT